MKWLKSMGGFLGYIVGAVVILPLILLFYNYFFINKNDSEKYIKPYMSNSTEILLNIPDYNNSKIVNDDIYNFKAHTISMQAKNMGRDGSRTTTIYFRLVYDSETRRYFQVTMFDFSNDFWRAINKNKVYAKVNKEDLLDKKLGSREKPILVFSVRGAGGPMEVMDADRKLVNYDTNMEQYGYNVYMYLTYIMLKESSRNVLKKKNCNQTLGWFSVTDVFLLPIMTF